MLLRKCVTVEPIRSIGVLITDVRLTTAEHKYRVAKLHAVTKLTDTCVFVHQDRNSCQTRLVNVSIALRAS